MSTFPKKSELRIGESSAFFTYVKSSTCKSINQGSSSFHENTPQHISNMENPVAGAQVDTNIQIQDTRPTLEKHSLADDHPITNNIPESFSMERSSTPISLEISQQMNSNGELNQEFVHSRNYSPGYSHTAYPYYMSGIMNQVTMSSIHNHANSTLLPQYNHIPQCRPQVPGMTSYPYYPFGICLQPGQIPAPHPWPLSGNCSSNEGKLSNGGDRREAALMKFRQKRKERCFDKKIRYVNRKKLAERRPRVKGQFVRKVNGINVDLNGQAENDEEEEEEYDEEY